jgi:hypothetical protein
MGTVSPLAIKLMAFGESAFIQFTKRSTHPDINEGSARFDDDGDLIVVTVTEPVEGHGGSLKCKNIAPWREERSKEEPRLSGAWRLTD